MISVATRNGCFMVVQLQSSLMHSSSSEDLQNRIPKQYERYRTADQAFRDLLQDVQAAPNVMATCKLEFTSAKGEGPLAQYVSLQIIPTQKIVMVVL